jgi:ATP-dependent DNA helicase RecQ
MGIDKADVKTVIHIQLPENMKITIRSRSIWQKWRKAFAVLLTNPSDKTGRKSIYTYSP